MRQITAYAADLQSVREAASRIAPYAHRTPVMTCSTIDELAGRRLFFKCELFQKAGSFKFRGACNAVMKLPDEEAQHGVVTHSSGNYAQALALAAKLRGCQVHIVMPRTASPIKRQSVEGYGGKIYLCEPTLAARESMAAELAEQTGAVMIPPYDHPDIIAGQGTAALELLEQIAAQEGEPLPPLRREGREVGDDPHPSPLPGREREFALDAIIAPIGGGGLISGTCITAKAINPNIRIFAAEPAGADDAARSLAAGRLIPQTNPNTICDGLLTSLGELTWPIVRDHVQRIITVDDEKIIAAMRLIWQRMKLIIEPSAAVAVAAVLSDEFKSLPLGSSPTSGGVGVILSGGNSDLDHLPW